MIDIRTFIRPSSCTSKGYTLIELLLYVVILGSLLTAISLYFSTSAESRIKNQSIAEVTQQGAIIMERITYTIRNADSITSPTAGNSAASLTLAMATAGINPTVFDVSSQVIRVSEGGGSAVGLSNSQVQISGLTFTNLTRSGTPGVVRISFTVSRVNNSNRNEYNYQKTFTASASLR